MLLAVVVVVNTPGCVTVAHTTMMGSVCDAGTPRAMYMQVTMEWMGDDDVWWMGDDDEEDAMVSCAGRPRCLRAPCLPT